MARRHLTACASCSWRTPTSSMGTPTAPLAAWSAGLQEMDVDGTRVRSVRASDAGVQARFYHEASYQSAKQYFLPNVDFVDVEPRKEVVASARGKPSMLQLAFQLAYCSTIHKVQAFTIRHNVHGCLEGIFALGQVYALWSRVTNSKLFEAAGLPPEDFLDEVAAAWSAAGHDLNACFDAAVEASGCTSARLLGAIRVVTYVLD